MIPFYNTGVGGINKNNTFFLLVKNHALGYAVDSGQTLWLQFNNIAPFLYSDYSQLKLERGENYPRTGRKLSKRMKKTKFLKRIMHIAFPFQEHETQLRK